jgi:hypothetical protein
MAAIAPILTIGMGLMSTIVQASGARAAAEGQMHAAAETARARQFEAQQLEMQGNEARAAAQRKMFRQRDQAQLAQSRLAAVAASQGGSVSDPTVVALGEDLAEEGEMQALTEMYNGENAYRGYQDAAMGRRMTAQASLDSMKYIQRAGQSQAMGTLFSGAGSMFSRFAGPSFAGTGSSSVFG